MKTLLIIDAGLGQARAYMAKTLLSTAAQKAQLELIDNPNDAELAIVLGATLPTDSALNGKKVYLGDINRAVAHPELFLGEARSHATPYAAPAATALPAATHGPKRIVAVTACPTGVAHTFMAAEAIETEAKKRGWWVKVETRGSVGAGNAITPEEVEQADLVVVAADIEVDLAKFAGKPMYRTTTGLALKKTAQELDKAVVEAKPYQPAGKSQAAAEGKKESAGAYRHLLTGVSYMLPMVVAGGLCIALSFAFGIKAFEVKDTLAAALLANGVDIVGRSFKYSRARGIVAAGAEEPNAILQIGSREATQIPNVRATQQALYGGLVATSTNGWPNVQNDLMAEGKSLVGVIEGDAVPALFIPLLVQLYKQGKFPIDKLIARYPLADINQAFADSASGKVIKPVVVM